MKDVEVVRMYYVVAVVRLFLLLFCCYKEFSVNSDLRKYLCLTKSENWSKEDYSIKCLLDTLI